MRRALLPRAAARALAGCGGGDAASPAGDSAPGSAPATTAKTTTEAAGQRMLTLYLVDPSDQKLYAISRGTAATPAVGGAALRMLAEDPDSEVPPNLSLT